MLVGASHYSNTHPKPLGPHRCLRDSYEARSPLGSGLTPYAPSRFTRKWVFLYFYSQSIHTTLSSVAGRRLSTRAHLQTCVFPVRTPQSTCRPRRSRRTLQCLSRVSAWSDRLPSLAPPLTRCSGLLRDHSFPRDRMPESCRLVLPC